MWARREARRALARERITLSLRAGAPAKAVRSAATARGLAEMIREATVDSAGGRTYSEVDSYLAPGGSTTSDASVALLDERTGRPVPNPDAELLIQSTTLQAALMQAYMAFRLADMSMAIGLALVVCGVGSAAAR